MSRLIDKIDINLVKEEIVDIEEIKSNLNKRVVQNDILRKESRTETSDATFDSDIWIIDKPLTQGYINLNMTFLSELKTFKRITDKEIPYQIMEARAGDPPALYANSQKAKNILKWTANKTLEDSISTAFQWELKRNIYK